MLDATITPVNAFGEWFAKREDFAGFTGTAEPSGAKVRQFVAMAKLAAPGTPMVVGCSADSAMQIYVAHAARVFGVRGICVVPRRAARSAATAWAAGAGADVIEIKPGYPACYRKRAKELAVELGGVVRWNHALALEDTINQCGNLPDSVRRVVVPTGSGLTAAAVLLGLSRLNRMGVAVIAVAVSDLASREKIIATALKFSPGAALPSLSFIPPATAYGRPANACLPDGSRLDPYYAAKALPHVTAGDCLWISGRRPDDLG